MKVSVFCAYAFLIVVGCKNGVPKSSPVEQLQTPAPAAAAVQVPVQMPDRGGWEPTSNGSSYQLSLKNNVFSFCDNIGPHEIDLTSGRQTAGTSACDRKNEAVKSGCGDQVDIVSAADGPFDTVSVKQYSFRLHGHVRDCDRDGGLVIVSTTGEIDLMNATTNKIAFIKADLPDTVVIASGWAAWNSQNKNATLSLEKTATLMRQAITPHDE